ncbi:hypothetical protein PMAYCL1PPCAC_27929, partial [Pristionchus mayeri]
VSETMQVTGSSASSMQQKPMDKSTQNDNSADVLAVFLSSPLKHVIIGVCEYPLSSSDLSVCAQLLRSSTIDSLHFDSTIIDDSTAPFIVSISSQAMNSLEICLTEEAEITDPAAFINTLYSHNIGDAYFSDDLHPELFFGLPRAFWEKFLNEKLSIGSSEWVVTGNKRGGKITKA